jgi:hypothetical protein
MTRHDRDFLIAWLVLLLAAFVFWDSMTMPMRGDFIESPGIFPALMSVILFLFGLAYVYRSWRRGGRLELGGLFRSVGPFFRSEEQRPLLLGILFPAVYVFIAIPLIGFYVSSALFMMVMFYAFVKRWRWGGIFLWVSLAITVTLYLVFDKLFMLQIW